MSKESTQTNCLDDMEEELERDKHFTKTSVLIDQLATLLIAENQMKDMGNLLAHFTPSHKIGHSLFKRSLNPSLDIYENAIQGNAESFQYGRRTKIHSFSNGISNFERAFVKKGYCI